MYGAKQEKTCHKNWFLAGFWSNMKPGKTYTLESLQSLFVHEVGETTRELHKRRIKIYQRYEIQLLSLLFSAYPVQVRSVHAAFYPARSVWWLVVIFGCACRSHGSASLQFKHKYTNQQLQIKLYWIFPLPLVHLHSLRCLSLSHRSMSTAVIGYGSSVQPTFMTFFM